MGNSVPSRAGRSSAAPTEAVPAEGTIAYAVARLARWGQLAPRGLARVEFVSEFARQHVVEALREELTTIGIPLHEVRLPSATPPDEIVRDLVRQFRSFEPGAVSISGFETAIPDDGHRVESLRVLNANREKLALHPLRQIWWMTPAFAQTFLQSVPDLDSWFMLRLVVEEIVPPPWDAPPPFEEPHGTPVPLPEARRRSASLTRRFQQALKQDAPAQQLLALALAAVSVLQEAGAEAEVGQLLNRLLASMHEAGKGVEGLLTAPIEAYPEARARAAALNRLAMSYVGLGRYAEAERPLCQALAIHEAVMGLDHPDTAQILNELAHLYRIQGRLSEAEPLYQRVLAIREKLGPNHSDTANSLNNLASLYVSQGRLAEAERLHQRALAICEKVLGPDHPATARSLNNLASLYANQGRLAEAELHFARALAIAERVLGPEHPNTATSLNNLACLYERQARLADAEVLFQRALAIREKLLGKEHPVNAETLGNLAGLYQTQGRLEDAEMLLKRALAIEEKWLGRDHPDAASTLNNLASLYREQARYTEAEPLLARALAASEATLGAEHPTTRLVRSNLGVLRAEIQARGEATDRAVRRKPEGAGKNVRKIPKDSSSRPSKRSAKRRR